jgi:hypothetical protein
MRTEVEQTPVTSFTSIVPQIMANVQYNIRVMNQPMSQTFIESSKENLSESTYLYLNKGAEFVNITCSASGYLQPRVHLLFHCIFV